MARRTRSTRARKSNSNAVEFWLITPAVYLIVGILLCIFKADVLRWCIIGFGVVNIFMAINPLMCKMYVDGFIRLLIGVFIIVFGALILKVAIIIFGVFMLYNGVRSLFLYFSKKIKAVSVVGAIINILLGIILIACNWLVYDWLFIAIGIMFILNGLAYVIKGS